MARLVIYAYLVTCGISSKAELLFPKQRTPDRYRYAAQGSMDFSSSVRNWTIG